MRFGSRALALVCTAALLAAAAPAHALRVATWNLLAYDPGNGGVTPRQASFRTVMAAMLPDILIFQAHSAFVRAPSRDGSRSALVCAAQNTLT